MNPIAACAWLSTGAAISQSTRERAAPQAGKTGVGCTDRV